MAIIHTSDPPRETSSMAPSHCIGRCPVLHCHWLVPAGKKSLKTHLVGSFPQPSFLTSTLRTDTICLSYLIMQLLANRPGNMAAIIGYVIIT